MNSLDHEEGIGRIGRCSGVMRVLVGRYEEFPYGTIDVP
jgi:hypothetical protein